ncbi:MAG: hypothetical protein FJ395_15755 [Verrucomicrobia bacterium]|nr:hypothetical protein [Verrucomicrobiota bacterium]
MVTVEQQDENDRSGGGIQNATEPERLSAAALEKVREARKVMGDDVVGMSDCQLAKVVMALDGIADMVLDACIKRRTTVDQRKAA